MKRFGYKIYLRCKHYFPEVIPVSNLATISIYQNDQKLTGWRFKKSINNNYAAIKTVVINKDVISEGSVFTILRLEMHNVMSPRIYDRLGDDRSLALGLMLISLRVGH